MGQKIHPTGFRLAVTRNWGSRWYAGNSNFASMLNEDLEVRTYLKKKLKNASVGRILIERPAKNARITIFSSRPGVVIGKKGEDIEILKTDLTKMMGVPVHVNIEEIRKPETDAQLIADSIAQQLEKRIMFRRAMKRAMQNAMRLGAQGIRIASSGRLNGIEIARTEWYREGRVPLHTPVPTSTMVSAKQKPHMESSASRYGSIKAIVSQAAKLRPSKCRPMTTRSAAARAVTMVNPAAVRAPNVLRDKVRVLLAVRRPAASAFVPKALMVPLHPPRKQENNHAATSTQKIS